METSKIALSLIIVAFNDLEDIKNCLESVYLYNDIGDKLEVIIVDNSTEDSVYDFVVSNYKNVKIVKSDNVGFGSGNNKGEKLALGDYLLFLNPDTELIEPIFQFACDKFLVDETLAMFGVKLLNSDLHWNYSFFYLDKFGILYSILTKWNNIANNFNGNKMFTSGADIFIRRDIFNKIGRFDDKMFMYNEEPDLVHRINNIYPNFNCSFFPEKKIIHKEGKSKIKTWVQYKNKLDIELTSLKYYCEKYDKNFSQLIKQRIRYEKFKKLLLGFNKTNTEFQYNLIQYLYDQLEEH